jgi:hypothetical protein
VWRSITPAKETLEDGAAFGELSIGIDGELTRRRATWQVSQVRP